MGGRGSGRPQFRAAGDIGPVAESDLIDPSAPGDERDDGDISQAIDQFPPDAAKVRIYKWGHVGPGAGDAGFLRCGTWPASEFDADLIPGRWGAGSYRLQFIGSDGRTVKHLRVAFAAPAAPVAPLIQQPAAGVATPAGAASDFQQFIIQMYQQQQQLLLALISRSGGGSDVKVADVLSAFREGRGLTPPAAPGESLLEAMRIGIEVAGNSGNGGRGDDGSMLETIAARMLGILEKTISTNPPPAPVAAAPTAAPRVTPGGGLTLDPLVMLAQKYAPLLIAEASKGRDAFTWGAFVAERTPEAMLPVLKRLVDATPENRMRVLSGIDSRLTQHTDWIAEAVEGIKDALYGDDLPPAQGGSGDLGDNGADPDDHSGGGSPADGAGRGSADQ